MRLFIQFLLFILTHLWVQAGFPSENISDPSLIKIGMSASLTGENQSTGNAIQQGFMIYFNKINSMGGIQGHKLDFIALDDAYIPERSIQNIKQLIKKDEVIAIVGNNGSASAVASVPIVNQEKILLFGAFPGTQILHKTPPDRYVINLRTGYKQEVQEMMKELQAAGIKPEQFAFLTQDDNYGNSIYQFATQSLTDAHYSYAKSLPAAQYPRNTVNVEDAVSQIISYPSKKMRVLILGGTTTSNVKIIKLVQGAFPDAYFVIFAGLMDANKLENSANEKVIMSEAVPYFKTSNLSAVKEYLDDLKKYGRKNSKPNAISFQAYLTAKLFVLGIQKAILNHQLSREGLIDAFENMHDVDIGIGNKIHFDKNHHDALNTVWPTIYKDSDFVPLNWRELIIK